jgi:hypothetical protein
MPPARIFTLFATTLAAAALAACGDTTSVTPATNVNVVDTVTLYALRGTAVSLPSGYDVPSRQPTRTDTPNFDFAFDLNDAGAALVYPAGALGLTADAGVLRSESGFTELETAPTDGYVLSEPLELSVNLVFVARSRPSGSGCILTGALPRYGKFRVLEIDPVSRTVTFETLVNQNCGYRDLKPGLPEA